MKTGALKHTAKSGGKGAVVQDMLRELLRVGRSVRFKVASGSMRPALLENDEVTVEGTRGAIACGDIVVYRKSGKMTVHRVVMKLGGRVITKGDALYRMDRPIAAEKIMGKVIEIRRKKGRNAGRIDMRVPSRVMMGKICALISLLKASRSLFRCIPG